MSWDKPDSVRQWETAIPKVCWTCIYCARWDDGFCKKHNANPPLDFQQTESACNDHTPETDIPF